VALLGIKVIIVGSSVAGLTCPIDCKRKGHNKLVLEYCSELIILGEFGSPMVAEMEAI
jgi:thioredoxin reductase